MLSPGQGQRMKFHRLKRREVITLLGGVAAWPIAAHGQQLQRVYRIGFLANDPAIQTSALGLSFLDGLREGRFFDGENILIDWRFAEGRLELYSRLADALV